MEPRMLRLQVNSSFIGDMQTITFIPNEVETYQLIMRIYLILHHFLLLCTMGCYGIIIRTVLQSSRISGGRKLDDIPRSLRQCCKASLLISIFSLLSSLFLVIPSTIDPDNASIENGAYFTFVYTLKGSITPIIMLTLFPKIWLQFLGRKQRRVTVPRNRASNAIPAISASLSSSSL
ncbi:hypothetical protein PENTCL1PPCAC_13503 [Pristionchus entomophagus]|uniref:G protein-coupled receptor n=1 Tax=Pristionchus entomophagus TaxID=358040 RepID=A0AAV5TB58_9BILA|nr:hypothetical protein PENTCL1PPCAC_13503 [Pristionchus entomophagus]